MPELPPNATLLDVMIMEGKRLYFAEQMLPNTPKHQIIEYSEDQYNGAKTMSLTFGAHL
ncbi:MAG: hypothetical protein R2728_07505 [Chitinophagales bacterium]